MTRSTKELVTVGKDGQIVIGKEFAGMEVIIEKHPDGRIVVSPRTFIPDHQKSFQSTEANRQLEEFNTWAAKNPAPSEPKNNLRAKLKTRTGR